VRIAGMRCFSCFGRSLHRLRSRTQRATVEKLIIVGSALAFFSQRPEPWHPRLACPSMLSVVMSRQSLLHRLHFGSLINPRPKGHGMRW
jgi:hypothetical protein